MGDTCKDLEVGRVDVVVCLGAEPVQRAEDAVDLVVVLDLQLGRLVERRADEPVATDRRRDRTGKGKVALAHHQDRLLVRVLPDAPRPRLRDPLQREQLRVDVWVLSCGGRARTRARTDVTASEGALCMQTDSRPGRLRAGRTDESSM